MTQEHRIKIDLPKRAEGEKMLLAFCNDCRLVSESDDRKVFDAIFDSETHAAALFYSEDSADYYIVDDTSSDDRGWIHWPKIKSDVYEASSRLLPMGNFSNTGGIEFLPQIDFYKCSVAYFFIPTAQSDSLNYIQQLGVARFGPGRFVYRAIVGLWNYTPTKIILKLGMQYVAQRGWESIKQQGLENRERIDRYQAMQRRELLYANQRRERLSSPDQINKVRWKNYYNRIDYMVSINR